MARSIRNWFRYTKVGMWYSNRKQGITLLSDKEYSKDILATIEENNELAKTINYIYK